VLVGLRRGRTGGELTEEREQLDGEIGIAVNDGREWTEVRDGDAELFAEFAGKGGLGRLAGLDFAAGKLPLESEVFVRRALRDEHLAGGIGEDGGDDGEGRLGGHDGKWAERMANRQGGDRRNRRGVQLFTRRGVFGL
jgi:hypothetical protein